MGKIGIKFISNKKEISPTNPASEKVAKILYLQNKHCLRKIQEIETEEDIIIEIDVDKTKEEILWERFKQLSPDIIEHIREIENYHHIFEELESIISRLHHCLFADRMKIKALGESALILLEGLTESRFEENLSLEKDVHLSRLKQIVKEKEVLNLTENVKPEDPLLIKIDAANNAVRRITQEIEKVRMSLAAFR